mgnify:CR=1 FL=1
MENDIPKIDLPDDWIIGNLSHKDNRFVEFVCQLSLQVESGDIRALHARRDRGFHKSDTLPSEARQLYHDPAGNNLTNS